MSAYDYQRRTAYIFDPNKPWEEQTPTELPPLSDEGEHFHPLMWSSDGRWIAGTEGEAALDKRVVLYSLESGGYQELNEHGIMPSWLPDSRRLLLGSYDGTVRLLDIESGNTREVFSVTPDVVFGGTISRDQRTLYFTSLAIEADIWMLTLNEERE